MRRKNTGDTAFRAVSHPTRRAVLDLLAEGERPVNDLVGRFDMTQPGMSQHLRVLQQAGLVTCRQQGRERFYRLSADPLKSVSDWVGQYERFWKDKLKNLGEFLDKEQE